MNKRQSADLDPREYITPDAKKKSRIPEDDNFQVWDAHGVYDHFSKNGFQEIATILLRERIEGRNLSALTHELLENIGISALGDRLDVLKIIRTLVNPSDVINVPHGTPSVSEEYKVFNDPVHGHIDLHPLCVAIIDTPQFQRLRYIKQLGACYYVFPGASHNRFEHSLGVCHLAGELVKALQTRQPELNITPQDILCVQIAGLCHDLGHGPFSHLYDNLFIPDARPGYKWQHEQASVDMFDYLVSDNKLEELFVKYGLEKKDRKFIKEQIAGPLYRDKSNIQNEAGSSRGWLYKGRDESRSFLYEIVANKRNGIDVDKWDYFARDCHHLGISTNFDHTRFMKFSRVIKEKGDLMQICCREKEVGNIYDMFHTRSVLHRRAYQHKTCRIIEYMIKEALLKADDHIRISGGEGKMYKLSECIDDMEAYTKLTDNIYHTILHSSEPELDEARNIICRIESRRLYKFIGQTKPKNPETRFRADQSAEISRQIAGSMVDRDDKTTVIRPHDIIVSIVNIDYGKKDKNPIDDVCFYNKANPDIAVKFRKEQVSHMLPEKFSDQFIRVYCRSLDKTVQNYSKICFGQWCKDKNMVEPKDGDVYSLEMTPLKPSPQKEHFLPEIKQATKTKLDF